MVQSLFQNSCKFSVKIRAYLGERYVRLMLSQIRLTSVCRLSVTLSNPTKTVKLFGNIFDRLIA